MAIGKSLNKLKQMAGEKMGSNKKTEQSDEFKRLTNETEVKKVLVDRLCTVNDVYLKTLTKKDGSDKVTVPESLGATMKESGRSLGGESTYASTLIKVGEAQDSIGKAQLEYVIRLRQGYIGNMERTQSEVKEYSSLKKKLESRRLDYDSKLNKVQKAKRESPELEEDMRAAQTKYEEVLADTQAKMSTILESEELQTRDLAAMVEAQLTFYRHAIEILAPLSTQLSAGGVKPSSPPPSMHGGDVRSAAPSSVRSQRAATMDDAGSYLARPTSTATARAAPVAPVAAAPLASDGRKQARVTFAYAADGDDELSLVPDQIITITEEIDEGWWIGESPSGLKGMFPANYVEVIIPEPAHAPPPMPSRTPTVVRASPPTQPPRQASLQDAVSSAMVTPPPPRTSASPSFPSSAHASMATDIAQAAATARSSTVPFPRPTASGRQFPTLSPRVGGGTPPPRPTGAKPPNAPSSPTSEITPAHSSTAVNVARVVPPATLKKGLGAVVGGMSTHVTSSPSSSSGDSASVAACAECGCDEFQPNVFKRGSCNNCFHKH